VHKETGIEGGQLFNDKVEKPHHELKQFDGPQRLMTGLPVYTQDPSRPAPVPVQPIVVPVENAPAQSHASARPPPGDAGYCVVCSKPADYLCKETKEPVCSQECKMINLERKGIAPSQVNNQNAVVQPQPASPQQPVLPHGWEARYDPTSGRMYYIDHNTHTTSWSPPNVEHNNSPAPAPAPVSASPRSAPQQDSNPQGNALPAGWEECVDPSTGRKFYKNHILKTTQWEYPTAPAQAPAPVPQVYNPYMMPNQGSPRAPNPNPNVQYPYPYYAQYPQPQYPQYPQYPQQPQQPQPQYPQQPQPQQPHQPNQ